MPELTVVVVSPPSSFLAAGYETVELLLPLKNERVQGKPHPEGLEFSVPWQLNRNGDPGGPCIVRQGDGRRFICFEWWGTKGGVHASFRRIKLYVTEELLMSSGPVRIAGTGTKNDPACSTAKTL